MTDCDKARETINPLELPMRNFASTLASHLNNYFASITAPTLRSTFSTQSTRLSRCHLVPAAAALGHEERFPPPSLSGSCWFQKRSAVVGDWAKAGFWVRL